ncbi:MAG: EcsC family protein, partial [Butyricicoccus pullicaecorum]
HQASIQKELNLVARQEQALRKAAMRQKTPQWKTNLQDKVPEKVYLNLEKAFCKAFEAIFDKGTDWIEKTYDAQSIRNGYEVHDFAFQMQADRKVLKELRRQSLQIGCDNSADFGVLGIGLPDIVLFVGVLLQGVYKIALHYGFDYRTASERDFILLLMETSVQKGEAWERRDRAVEAFIAGQTVDMADQLTRTAQAFADDLVLAKAVQGLPLVGVLGGLFNPVCCRKVMKYAELKYRKRCLLRLYESSQGR